MMKIEKMISEAYNLPILLFCAIKNDYNKKPQTGMWSFFKRQIKLQNKFSEMKIDKKQSFFVGNLAGRENDKSNTDRTFALNLNLPFFTPEEFFLKKKPEKFAIHFHPASFLASFENQEANPLPHVQSDPPEVLFLVGSPVSGKSFVFF